MNTGTIKWRTWRIWCDLYKNNAKNAEKNSIYVLGVVDASQCVMSVWSKPGSVPSVGSNVIALLVLGDWY